MINPLSFYEDLYKVLSGLPLLSNWSNTLRKQLEQAFDQGRHGHLEDWCFALAQMPAIKSNSYNLAVDRVTIGSASDCELENRNRLEKALRVLHPWRKGPFEFFGIHIDTEWRSDWKWNRLKDHVSPLDNRVVLDVGCGNGYYCWRMAGNGARLVVGIDPFMVYIMQYQAARKYCTEPPVYVLPLGIEDMPQNLYAFDTVFSMGVLYHQRSPKQHLEHLHSLLCPGGELVLETLIIEDSGNVLIPETRYAKMRNVWSIPGIKKLRQWLLESKFSDIRLVDITKTTTNEQRVTNWMNFESLANFLDPSDPNKTIEGYPAPLRAVMIANKKI